MKQKIIYGVISLLAAILLLFIYISIGRKNLILPKEYVKEKYKFSNSYFLQWRGAELHYTESGSGMPILMIHGFGGSNRDFLLLDSLINDKYKVIRVDMPGFGLSDFPVQQNPNVDYIKVFNDYFEFMLTTLHIDSCYVMGNSLGGLMAWNLALNKPNVVKKLILFNSAGYDMTEVMKTANVTIFRNPLVQVLIKRGIPLFMSKDGLNRVLYNKTLVTKDRIQTVNDLWNRAGNLQQIMNMASSNNYPDWKQIKNISCPTLIVWGQQDIIINPKYAEQFHKDIKQSHVIMYDSCGHVPMLEKPNLVKRDVLSFLQNN